MKRLGRSGWRRPRCAALLLALCTCTLASAQKVPRGAPKPGERLPAIVLEGYERTPARSLSDFYGRALLIEFFAYWSRPSATIATRMDRLQDQLVANLTVLKVTRESPRKTEPWIAEHEVRCASAYDTSGALHTLFGVKEPPFAVLLDVSGVIVWEGPIRGLRQEPLARAMLGAVDLPVWRWPEDARPIATSLSEGRFAEAMALARARTVEDDFDAVAMVEGRLRQRIALFEKTLKRGERLDALRLARQIQQELQGLVDEAFEARLRELEGDPELQRQLALDARFRALQKRVKTVEDLEGQLGELEGLLAQKPAPELEARVRNRQRVLQRLRDSLPEHP